MENRFKLPFAPKKGVPSEKNSTLLQVIVVISSGILSSSVIATALKTWLDNRRTTLTIRIDGGRKTFAYKGHHLSQDAATIQTIVETLNEKNHTVIPTNTVTIDMTDDGPTGEALLEAGNHQEITTHDDCSDAHPQQHPSRVKRLLPVWLSRSREALSFAHEWEKHWRRLVARHAS